MKKNGFSLAEMMIVLLMIAIALAATAPMITRKISRDRTSGKVFEKLNVDPENGVEYIKGRNQRIYMNARPNGYVGIRETSENIPLNSVLFGYNLLEDLASSTNVVGIGFGTKNDAGSVAIGYNAQALAKYSIALGRNSLAKNSMSLLDNYAIAIGSDAQATHGGTISIGYNAQTTAQNAIAIGRFAKATEVGSTAIGYNAQAVEKRIVVANRYPIYSTAIGYNAQVNGKYSTAIGYNARALLNHTIVLGTADDTVYIPGNLVVNHSALIGLAGLENDNLYFRAYANEDGRHFSVLNAGDWKGGDSNVYMARDSETGQYFVRVGPYETTRESHRGDYGDNNKISIKYTTNYFSDIRLKNIGSEFTNGLDELNKLKFYHFTFKSDKTKAPHVSVIAQDLQKVFPDSVSKDSKGYLLIRWDEMFYAAINGIKELNNKVNSLAQNVQNITNDLINLKTITEQQQVKIDKQEKIISEQQTELKSLEARIARLEHKNKE